MFIFFVVSITFSSYWGRACLVVIIMNREEIDHIHSLLLSLLHGSHKTLVIDSMVLIVNVSGIATSLLMLHKSAHVPWG